MVAFPQSVIDKAWARAGGRCECRRSSCGHTGRCNKELDPKNATEGKKWDAHHKVAVGAHGADSLDNCEILCITCHQNTRSYGG